MPTSLFNNTWIVKAWTVKVGNLTFRFNWLVSLAVIATMVTLIKLGLWQLGRAEEKRALQQSASSQQQTLDIADTLAAGDAIKQLPQQNQLMTIEGEFQDEFIFFLVFQTYEDQLGYEVITPVRISESSRWLLVSRGWVNPTVVKHPQNLPLLQGTQRLEGNAFIPPAEPHLNNIETINWPLQIRFQNISELEKILNKPLFPYIVRLSENSPGVLIRHWPYVMPETAQHISYAIQWFAMAAAVFVLSLIGCSNLVALIRARMAKGEEDLRNL